MSPRTLCLYRFAAVCCIFASPAFARDQLRIVGSGTLYPFVTLAAEQFGQDEAFKTPIVESTGTGGGFKLFCEGVGDKTPDITNASRKITVSELERCRTNGVQAIVEVPVGYDGIVLARKKGAIPINLTRKQLFTALARQLPDASGHLAANPYTRWNAIDPELPDQPIKIYGPGTVSGTRDAFAELVMEKTCEQFPAFAERYSDASERKKNCQSLREDGTYVESGENYNILVQKLMNDETSLGIMGYSFYALNPSKVQASAIDGVTPNVANIADRRYAISRPLYIYVKTQHIGIVPGITEFVQEITSDHAIGADGYITDKGLIPLSPADHTAMLGAMPQLSAP